MNADTVKNIIVTSVGRRHTRIDGKSVLARTVVSNGIDERKKCEETKYDAADERAKIPMQIKNTVYSVGNSFRLRPSK